MGNVLAVDTWGANGLLARSVNSGGTYSHVVYAFDASGNTSQRLDSSGNVLETLLCSAYGSLQSNNPSTDPFRGMGAQSGVQLDSTGLYYLPDGRYYDAGTGAMLSRNPGGGGGGNGYSPFGLNTAPNGTPVNGTPVNGTAPTTPSRLAGSANAANSAGSAPGASALTSAPLLDTLFGVRTAQASGSSPGVSSTKSNTEGSLSGRSGLSAASALDSRSSASALDSLASVSTSAANVSASSPVSMREQLQDALDTRSGSLDNTSSHSVEDVAALGGRRHGRNVCDDPNASDSGDPADTYIPTSGWDELRHAGGGRRAGAMARPFFNYLLDNVPGGGLIPAITGRDTFGCEVEFWDRIESGITGALGLAEVLGPLVGGIFRSLKRGCFVAGTPVQMADGTRKPIEEVKSGDSVQSRDETTGKATVKKVERVTVRQVNEVETIHFAASKNGATLETLVTTREHPFYVEGKGFVPAGSLCIGNAVVTRAGPALIVTSVTFTQGSGVAVYNMTVADTHTYFVGTANGGTWVHNADVCNPLHLPLQNAKSAEAALSKGVLNVRVNSAEEAEAIRKSLIVGQGYRNSTGFTGKEVRNSPELFPDAKMNTYHYDYGDTKHGGMPHMQYHPPDGTIRRIFFPGGGMPIGPNTWSK